MKELRIILHRCDAKDTGAPQDNVPDTVQLPERFETVVQNDKGISDNEFEVGQTAPDYSGIVEPIPVGNDEQQPSDNVPPISKKFKPAEADLESESLLYV